MNSLDGLSYLIPKLEEDISVAVKALHQWNCCPKCILRFLGDKDPYSFKKSKADFQKWLSDFIKSPKAEEKDADAANDAAEKDDQPSDKTITLDGQCTPSETVCVSCVGLLQDRFCSDSFCTEIHEAVQKADFEFDSYFLSLSIPVPLMVREHAILVKLKELLPKVYDETVYDEVTPIKDVWKWVCGPKMNKLLTVRFDQKSLFEVKLDFFHPDLEKECNFFFTVCPDTFCKRKNNKHGWEVFTRVNVPNALSEMGEAKFKKHYQCPPRPLQSPCVCQSMVCTHEAVYVAGRYNKYSRHLSQTPWVVEGERRTDSSVEEMICDLLHDAYLAKEHRFSSSGREDVDVLMLGRGRPFVIELVNPRRIHFTAERIAEIQAKINTSHSEVRVRDLQQITRQDTKALKQGEEEKVKHYSALCWTDRPVTQQELDDKLLGIRDLVIKQKTPIRVLHRRSLASRDRTIHEMTSEVKPDGRHFTLNLSTQAGTYIKEFVHGDFGRTQPNLCHILGAECDILELNVTGVDLDWPKQLEDLDTS